MTKIPVPVGSTSVLVDFEGQTAPPVNELPKVNAGSDQIITLPDSSITLNGSASDPEGKSITFLWEGTGGTIVNPHSASTQITNLQAGTWKFRLTVTDEQGGTSFDEVQVIVNKIIITPPVGFTQVYFNPFEKDSDIRNNTTQQAGKGIINRDPAFIREGTGSFLSIPENVSSGIRSEIQGIPTPNEAYAEWWALYGVAVSDNGHSWQIHPGTDGGSGSPCLFHSGKKFVMCNQNKPGASWTQYPTGVSIPEGTWNKYRIEYKMGASGYCRLYMNDKLLVGWSGQVGDNSLSYMKLGWNGWTSSAEKSRIYYDSFRVFQKN